MSIFVVTIEITILIHHERFFQVDSHNSITYSKPLKDQEYLKKRRIDLSSQFKSDKTQMRF